MATRRPKKPSWDALAEAFAATDWSSDPRVQELDREEEERNRPTATAGSPNTRGRYRPEPSPWEQTDPYGSALVDAAQAGLQRTIAGQVGLTAANLGDESREQTTSFTNPIGNSFMTLSNNVIAGLRKISPWYDEAVRGVQAWARETGTELGDSARANDEAVQRQMQRVDANWLDEGVVDVVSSPTSFLSVFGGPTAGITGADVLGQEYIKGRDSGLSHKDAFERASAMSSVETGLSVIPTGKWLSKVPGIDRFVGDVIEGSVNKWARRTAATAAGESLQEGATTLAQIGVDSALSQNSDSESLRQFADSQLPQNVTDFYNQMRRSMVAGAIGGGALGQIEVHNSIVADNAKLVSDMMNADTLRELNVRAPERRRVAEQPPTNAVTLPPVETQVEQLELFPEIAPGPSSEVTSTEPTEQPSDEPGVNEFDNRRSVIRGLITRERNNIANLEQAQQKEAELQGTGYEGTVFGQFEQGQLERARSRLAQLEQDMASMRGMPARQGQLSLRERTQPTPKAPANIQTRGGDTYIRPDMTTGSTVDDAAVTEANKLLEQQTKDDKKRADAEFKKQTTAYNKKRRTAQTTILEQARTVPVGERARFVANGIREWDAANPAPVRGDVDAPVVTTAPAVTDEQRAAYRENFPDASDADIDRMIARDTANVSSVQDLRNRVGLPMQQAERSTGVKPADVVETIRSRIGNKQANTFAKLIGDGKLVLDENESTMPVRGAGAYVPATGQVHINTSALDPNNIMGSVLEQIAGHEFDHAARISKDKEINRSLGGLLNDKVTDKLVSDLENMAKGNSVQSDWAQHVLNLAKKGSTPETYKAEVVGYAVSEALKDRRSKAPILRTALSGVRTWAKRVIPGVENDINVNDLAYLSDRLVEAAARTSGDLVGEITPDKPLAMVMGESAPGFAQAREEGRTFTDVDGKEKFVTSDSASRLRINNSIRRMLESDGIQAKFLIDHPELFNSYPKLGDIVIKQGGEGNGASYSESANTIFMSPNLVTRMFSNAIGTDVARGILLHELQHGIQGMENFARGGSPDQFITGDDKKIVNRYNKALKQLENISTRLENAGLPPSVDGEVRSTLQQWRGGNMTTNEAFGVILQEMESAYRLPSRAAEMAASIREALDTARELGPATRRITDLALQKYYRLRGEQEAYFVGENANLPLDQLPTVPTYEGEPIVSMTPGALSMSMDATALRERMENPDVNTNLGKSIQIGKAQLLYHSGLGKELYDRLQLASGEAAVDAQRGLNAGANIDRGISRLAKRTGQTEEEVRQMVKSRMDSLAKLPTPEARQRALSALVRANPELGHLAKAYSDINQLTKTLVAQMLETNPNPTEDDLRFMSDLLNNSFGYTTRMYAAYQGEAGSEYAQKLMNDYRAAERKIAKDKKLSKAQEAAYKRVTDAIKYLSETDLTIPSANDIGKISINKLRYLYDNWIGDATRDYKLAYEAAVRGGAADNEANSIARQKLAEELIAFAPNLDTARIQERAIDAVNSILGLNKNKGAVPQYLRTASSDRGILQKRQDLPQEIRSLLGEISDPSTRVAATIAKQGELAARNKFLLFMRDNGQGRWVASPQEASQGKFTAELNGEGFGPLNGWKTTPQIEAVINDQLGMFSSTADALAAGFAGADAQANAWYRTVDRGIKRGAAAAKVASIIMEGFSTAMNIIGSPAILAVNGVTNPKKWYSGAKSSVDLLMQEVFNNTGELSDATKRAIRLGVVDSAKVNELRDSVQHRVRDRIIGRGPVSQIGRGLQRAKRIGVEAFAQTDVWPKIAALEDRIDMLTKYYKANGQDKTAEQIEQEAATVVKDSNISYDRVPPALKFLEARGITTFMPYFYSVPRSLVHSAAIGAKDMVDAFDAKTPEAKLIKAVAGAKRLTGVGAATFGAVTVMQGIVSALNGEDDDMVDEARKVMHPEGRYGNPVYLGKDETGAPIFFRTSRLDPYGPVNDLLRMIMDPATTKDQMLGATASYVKDLAFANRYTKVLLDMAAQTVGDSKPQDRKVRLERIAPETVSYLKDAARTMGIPSNLVEGFVSLADTQLPGISDAFDPNNKIATDPKDPWVSGNVVRALGGRLDRGDPGSRAYEIGQDLKAARDEARKYILEYQNTGRTSAALREAIKADNKVYDLMRQATDLYEGMVNGLDYSPRQARDVLKEAGLDSKDLAMVMQGRVPEDPSQFRPGQLSGAFSKSSLEQRSKVSDKMLSREERAEAQRNRQEFLRKLREEGAATRD